MVGVPIILVSVVGIVDSTVVVLGGEEAAGHITVGVTVDSGQSRIVSCGDLALICIFARFEVSTKKLEECLLQILYTTCSASTYVLGFQRQCIHEELQDARSLKFF